jgi:lysophospholipase L1-like esterase
MKPLSWKNAPRLALALPLLGILALAAVSGCVSGPGAASQGTAPAPQGTSLSPQAAAVLISRSVPAFASSAYTAAAQANDASYDTSWRSVGVPAWLAYDLSGVPAAQRGKVLVVWYNETFDYDHTLVKENAYNIPEDYALQAHTGPGGGPPPASGWVTLLSVTGNHYHSRQHLLNLTRYTWLRLDVTAIDGSVENEDAQVNMDVYDASAGVADDWIFYGDSITAGSMGHTSTSGVLSFPQLINSAAPAAFPIEEDGGIGYLTSADGAAHLPTWLRLFPGRYVGLSYGTNDAIGCVAPERFYQNYSAMVQAVLAAGKVPVIPQMPWGRAANIQRCGPALNAQIEALYQAFPQIVTGPNLWTFFQTHQDLISSDNIHPDEAGMAAYRQQWATSMLKAVYGKD